MSKEQAKKLAEEFIQSQERILEEYGDSVVKSKRKNAIASVQQIFQAITSRTAKTQAKNGTPAKSGAAVQIESAIPAAMAGITVTFDEFGRTCNDQNEGQECPSAVYGAATE